MVSDLESMAKALGFIKKGGRRFFRIVEKYFDPDNTLDAIIKRGGEDPIKLRHDISAHISELRGCEVTFFEYLEIVVNLALMAPGTTKIRSAV